MSNVKAVIFDWAGTIIDYGCMAPAFVFIKVFMKYGVNISEKEARAPMGLAKKDHVRALCKMPGIKEKWKKQHGKFPDNQDVENIYLELEPMLTKIVANYSDPIPGAVELLKKLKQTGIRSGSTTGYVQSMMNSVVPAAKRNGLIPESILCSSDVPGGRPKPWMCFMNAINLNVYPMNRLIKVGDTLADIQEGLNAGMWTVGVSLSGNEIGMTEGEVKMADKAALTIKNEKARRKMMAAGAHFVIDGVWDFLPVLEKIEDLIEQGETPYTYSRNYP